MAIILWYSIWYKEKGDENEDNFYPTQPLYDV